MKDLGRGIYLIIHMLVLLQTLFSCSILGITDDQSIPNFFYPSFRIDSYPFIHVSLDYLIMIMVIVSAELQTADQQTKHRSCVLLGHTLEFQTKRLIFQDDFFHYCFSLLTEVPI